MASEAEAAVVVGSVATTLGGAIGYLLNHLRQRNKDSYAQVRESTQELINAQNSTIKDQKEQIQRLEGRLDQITLQMATTINDAAMNKAELQIANATIVRLQAEVDEWQRRWNNRFPDNKEML